MNEWSLWEPEQPLAREAELDALLKPVLVAGPPDHVQQATVEGSGRRKRRFLMR